jgi:signal transduction histidine kinase
VWRTIATSVTAMLDNLRLAARNQTRLILTFLLAIVIPSVSLGIFGITAIRNEEHRLARLVEKEHRSAAELVKSRIQAEMAELSDRLMEIAGSEPFRHRDASGIRSIIESQLAADPTAGLVFVAFDQEETAFPLFEIAPAAALYADSEAAAPPGLAQAEAREFRDRDFRSAASLYRRLFERSSDADFKALMLVNVSRCLMKAGDFPAAVATLQDLSRDYPESSSSSGVPLALAGRLQMASCYRTIGERRSSRETLLDLYADILGMRWPLPEPRFRTYAEMVEAALAEDLAEDLDNRPQGLESLGADFDRLRSLHGSVLEQWETLHNLEEEVVPELHRRRAELPASVPLRYAGFVGDRTLLVSAVRVPRDTPSGSAGLLGVEIKAGPILERAVAGDVERMRFLARADIVVSDLSGRVLFGSEQISEGQPTTVEFFRDSFPPWRIATFHRGGEPFDGLSVKRSFYFWTILTLIFILAAGTIMVSRTIANEMAVIGLKSDFVSSVSHELKSPLTSIKSLVDRLRNGKVTSPAQMQSYFAVIERDVERLTRMVSNILCFARAEEGKTKYERSEIDPAAFVLRHVEAFKKSGACLGVEIRLAVDDLVPRISVDADAFALVLDNLLDNAAKFSPDHKEIYVVLSSEAGKVVLEVRDRGTGIPSGEVDRIFEKFYQVRHVSEQSIRGTGLGLTLVKDAVEAHGGRIDVESRLGEGSSFTVTLPVPTNGE